MIFCHIYNFKLAVLPFKWCCVFSTLGGMLLVGGLYFVLWGKNKEQTISETLKEGTKEGNDIEEGKDITKVEQ